MEIKKATIMGSFIKLMETLFLQGMFHVLLERVGDYMTWKSSDILIPVITSIWTVQLCQSVSVSYHVLW